MRVCLCVYVSIRMSTQIVPGFHNIGMNVKIEYEVTFRWQYSQMELLSLIDTNFETGNHLLQKNFYLFMTE